MNYLIITNNGHIEPQDLYLIGSSTKRADESKIGMFGSGWKFALAWLMRNDCLPKIFSGYEQIGIDFNVVMHRNNPVRVITINEKETSLTSEMGMKWSGWMAIREIISNASDEGGYTISNLWNPSEFKGEDGKTTIYIPMNNELANVLISYNNYFSFERTVSFENEIGRIYVKQEATKMVIYRKGIRCYDSSVESKSDFDFNEIEIDENRLAQGHNVSYRVSKFVSAGVTSNILRIILADNYLAYLPKDPNAGIIENLKEFLSAGEVFTCPNLQGIGGIFLIKNPTMMIPNGWYRTMADLGLVENPFKKFTDTGAPDNFIKTEARDIAGIKYLIDGFNLKLNFNTGVFQGSVHVSEDNVYINDNCKDQDDEIAASIMYGISRETFKSQMK